MQQSTVDRRKSRRAANAVVAIETYQALGGKGEDFVAAALGRRHFLQGSTPTITAGEHDCVQVEAAASESRTTVAPPGLSTVNE
jgi:hypothetical protein